MKQISTHKKAESACSKCGAKLTYFIAYIPGLGEACMKCAAEYAQLKEFVNEEKKTL